MTPSEDPVARGSAEQFPGSHPHPVIRVADDGRLTYAKGPMPTYFLVGESIEPVAR